jgi:hypothetical protein
MFLIYSLVQSGGPPLLPPLPGLARAVPRDNIRQAPDENTEILMNDLLVNELFDDSGEVRDSGGGSCHGIINLPPYQSETGFKRKHFLHFYRRPPRTANEALCA